MRLLVDLQGMQNNSRDRGIGRYVAALARGLLRNAGQHEIRFLLNRLFPDQIEQIIASFSDIASSDQFIVFDAVGPTAALHDPNRWRAEASHVIYDKLVADLAPDALLLGSLFEGGADNTVVSVGPANRNHLVAAVLYDLIPLLNPDEHISSAGAQRWYFDKVAQARSADLLLGISASACREGVTHLPSDDRHVVEIGAAAAEEFAQADFTSLRGTPIANAVLAYHDITKPFLMHTSAFDARKNFEGLIAAFAKLPPDLRDRHQLVLVCKLNQAGRQRLSATVASHGLTEEQVVLTGYVPDDELRVLYANCALFVFPSFHEGFGLPVVEAMWCGAPAVGSSLSSVPEVIGLDEAQFDPNDMESMVAVIGRALGDAAFRQTLLSHAHTHARSFSWDKVAKRAIAAITTAVERRACDKALDQSPSMTHAISRVARSKGWPGPTDDDLMAAAIALSANEELQWQKAPPDISGIHKVAAL